MPNTIKLVTDRLILRPWRDADYEPFYIMSVNPLVSEYLPPLPDRAACDGLVDHLREEFDAQGWGFWAIEGKEESCFMGTVGMHEPGPEFGVGRPCVEIGWRLDPKFWGQGYATEAAREVLRYGFEKVGFSEIVSFAALGNERSFTVMERIGMKRDPENFDLLLLPQGHPHRVHCLYSLSREAWRASLQLANG